MTFAEAVSTCFSKYATFSGRAKRPEFWYFMLFVLLVSIATMILDRMIFDVGYDEDGGVLGAVFSLLVFVPQLAVSWRRMHDTGRKGIWVLLPMAVAPLMVIAVLSNSEPLLNVSIVILVILYIMVLVWFASAGDQGPNDFGDEPYR